MNFHFDSKDGLPRFFSGGQIRRLRPGDCAAFQRYRMIPELGRYQSWTLMSEVEALRFLTQMSTSPLFSPGEWIQVGIAEAISDRLIGDLGLFVSEDERSAEVGFTLDPDAQGRGVATAAVREVVQLLFAATKICEVYGITDARNKPSIRLLERAGFCFKAQREATFRGEQCSEMIYVHARRT